MKITRLMSAFTSKKVLIKIQLTKSNPKIIRGVNPPCLMPIKVKDLGHLLDMHFHAKDRKVLLAQNPMQFKAKKGHHMYSY